MTDFTWLTNITALKQVNEFNKKTNKKKTGN